MFPHPFMMVSQLENKGQHLKYPLSQCIFYDLKIRVIFPYCFITQTSMKEAGIEARVKMITDSLAWSFEGVALTL